jgi:hypothetical protein
MMESPRRDPAKEREHSLPFCKIQADYGLCNDWVMGRQREMGIWAALSGYSQHGVQPNVGGSR